MNMTVPSFNGYYLSEIDMTSKQLKFYKTLELSISHGVYLDVSGNVGYLFVYLHKLLNKWNDSGYEELYEYLLYISELYCHETKVSEACNSWAYDCLLGLGEYEKYLEKTEPKIILGTKSNVSSLRLNVQNKIGLKANPLDLALLVGRRKSKIVVSNNGIFKSKLIDVFEQYASENGDWFSLLNSEGDYLYPISLFSGAVLEQTPRLKWRARSYGSKSEYFSEIQSLMREAENLSRDDIGVPRIGEGWISETELFRKLE